MQKNGIWLTLFVVVLLVTLQTNMVFLTATSNILIGLFLPISLNNQLFDAYIY